MSHTPGPWKWDYESGEALQLKAGQALVLSIGSGRVPSSKDANLLAAAPELLTACKALLSDIGDVARNLVREAHGKICATDPCAVCQVEAAIAKAEGK